MSLNLKRMWIGVLFCLSMDAQGHPGHDSVTQAVYRSEVGLLEITVSVHAGDLEEALSRQLGRQVAINSSEDERIDQHILRYLQERFLLEKDDGQRLKFVWVGREMGKSNAHHADGELVLLHFEAAMVGGLETVRVRQGIFCEFNDDQINLVHLREDDRKLTLGFSPQHEAKTVAFTQGE